MKHKIILSNVWLISLIPFIIIAIIAPVGTAKYDLELIRTDLTPAEFWVYYDDLDNDGISERIVAYDEFNTSGISISNPEGIIDQWNFGGSFDFQMKNGLFISGDSNNDGKKELYIFTTDSVSIYLSCINDLRSREPSFRSRLIAETGKGIKKPDPSIIPAEMDDLDGDGIKELIFGITSGFSRYPRNIFAYFITKDSLVSSPESSYYLQGIVQEDITGDGRKEIMPWGYAAGNVSPAEAKYHDYSSYLMVLDQNLKFIFKPLEFKGEYSHLYPLLKKDVTGLNIAGLYTSKSLNKGSVVYIVSPHGTIKDSIQLDILSYFAEPSGENHLLMSYQKELVLYNSSFKKIKSIPLCAGAYAINDVDDDGSMEYIFHDTEQGTLNIFREGLEHPASLKLTIASTGWDILTMRRGYEPESSLSLQTGQNHYIIGYQKNTAYLLGYVYYPGIYFSILAFAFLIRGIQRAQVKKKYENEKKISELQMALIRNQLDPHFTLNALNSIIYSVNYGDRDEAADSLRCFAGIYRDLLLSAGSSRRTIQDEIAFCRNYLTMEKLRFGDQLDYCINIDPGVNMNMLIPKFLIQIHCENAIKHGLSPLESGGMLKVDLSCRDNELTIAITDNGIGREKSEQSDSKGSTRKGMEIMDELYKLYYKIYREKIGAVIIDLYDTGNRPAGTQVLIKILQQGENNPLN